MMTVAAYVASSHASYGGGDSREALAAAGHVADDEGALLAAVEAVGLTRKPQVGRQDHGPGQTRLFRHGG
jgi:hypothetical protein